MKTMNATIALAATAGIAAGAAAASAQDRGRDFRLDRGVDAETRARGFAQDQPLRRSGRAPDMDYDDWAQAQIFGDEFGYGDAAGSGSEYTRRGMFGPGPSLGTPGSGVYDATDRYGYYDAYYDWDTNAGWYDAWYGNADQDWTEWW